MSRRYFERDSVVIRLWFPGIAHVDVSRTPLCEIARRECIVVSLGITILAEQSSQKISAK